MPGINDQNRGRNRNQLELGQRHWVASILGIPSQAAYELLQQATEDELNRIESSQSLPRREQQEVLNSLAAAISERRNLEKRRLANRTAEQVARDALEKCNADETSRVIAWAQSRQ